MASLRRAAPPLLACLLLAPLAGADVYSGTAPFGLDAPHVPQAYCVIVQDKPGEERCQVHGVSLRGVHVMRVRVWGEGHAFAWADQHLGGNEYKQHGPIECSADLTAPSWSDLTDLRANTPATKTCLLVLSTAPNGLTATFSFQVWANGPGRAVYAVDFERVAISLP